MFSLLLKIFFDNEFIISNFSLESYLLFKWFFIKFSFYDIFENIILFLLLIIPLLITIAFFTLIERKIMASIQRRQGPNLIGWLGLLQPFADGLKLFLKETIIPSNSNKGLFLFSPVFTFFLSLFSWLVIPFNENIVLVNLNFGVLFIFTISSLGVYGIILAGWSSNSKYAFLGSLRSAAQMISYEISIGLVILPVILCSKSLNLTKIVLIQESGWFLFFLFPSFLMFLISILAETNRTPFDLPEAEAELVSGYNVEYSSMGFALFFLAEYSNIILMSTLTTILFLGGWLPFFDFYLFNFIPKLFWFSIKVGFIIYFFIWVRASLPRYRYDQLMTLGWKRLLPLSLGYLVFIFSFLLIFDGF